MSNPIFVPKQEGVVALTLDEAIDRIVAKQEERDEINKELKNLKEVAKAHLKEMNSKAHTAPSGHKAQWISSQRQNIDKELCKELLGDDFGRVTSFTTVNSFKVS